VSFVIGVVFYSTSFNRRGGFGDPIDERAADPRNAFTACDGGWVSWVATNEKKLQHTRLMGEFTIASVNVVAIAPHSARRIGEASVAARAPRYCVDD
jgi:hypothetical protein